MTKYNPLKHSYSSKAYKFWIKEREDEIKYLKEEINLFKTYYKMKLKKERKQYDNRKVNRNTTRKNMD